MFKTPRSKYILSFLLILLSLLLSFMISRDEKLLYTSKENPEKDFIKWVSFDVN